jgi:hypothetical protein
VRLFFIILIGIGLHTSTSAQLKDAFRHSVGAGVSLLQNKGGVSPAFGLYYHPQINYLNKFSDFSMSVGLPVMLGAHIKSSFVENTFFYAKIPFITEANIGHYATRDFTNSVGMTIGGGYAMQYTNRGLGHGPVATISTRTWIKHVSITVRYLGMFQIQRTNADDEVIDATGYHTHMLVLAFNMGDYLSKVRQMNKISKWMNPFRN